MVGPRRAIASHTSRALPAASVQPSAPWPVFSTKLAIVVRPMIGRPLGVAGRSPVRWPQVAVDGVVAEHFARGGEQSG